MKAIRSIRFLPVFLGIVVFVLMAATAPADVIYQGNYFDIEVSSPIQPDANLPLWAVTLTAVCEDGFEAGAFDGTGAGGGITTDGDLLHQVWQFGAMPTPTLSPRYQAIPEHLDTHFLIGDCVCADPNCPDESGLAGVSPTGDSRAGFGNALYGAFAVCAGETEAIWDFAYLVVPWGTEISLNCDIGVKQLSGGEYLMETVETTFVVPEPSTLLLLVLGAVGLLQVAGRR